MYLKKGSSMKNKDLPLGSLLPAFNNLPGVDGREYSSSDFMQPILVVVFSCNHCPYVRAYEGRIKQLQQDYAQRGVTVIAINSNDSINYPEDDFPSMVKRSNEMQFNYIYVRDENQIAAEVFGATHTPQFFVFDRDRKLQYKGKMDDNWQEPSQVKHSYLRDAIDALLNGEKVQTQETYSIGCTIKWK
jgi:glutathione peroxidase-family protein